MKKRAIKLKHNKKDFQNYCQVSFQKKQEKILKVKVYQNRTILMKKIRMKKIYQKIIPMNLLKNPNLRLVQVQIKYNLLIK